MSMTLKQLRDWHAKRTGLCVVCEGMIEEGWIDAKGNEVPHLFPPTLDGSELAKTPGWWLSVHHRPKHGGGETWYGDAMNTHPDGGTGYKSVTETAGNEIELRYLLWMKAWEQEAAR